MATSVKNNFMDNQALISNLQRVLIHGNDNKPHESSKSVGFSRSLSSIEKDEKTEEITRTPVVLVTNGEGIDSPGLSFLVEALVRDGLLDVHVCAPQSNRSVCGHAVTTGETLAACSAEVGGANAYEVSGTPADCVSLALSGALFSWSKPLLVISGLNTGSSCGFGNLYSGAIAGAREALISGVPSLCVSLNGKTNVSRESDLKDAVTVSLPLIRAAIRDIKKGIFPENCMLNIGIPSSPLANKGIKVTRQSQWRPSFSWQAVTTNRRPLAPHYMANQQSLGIMLAQLGRDASAAGAARRLNSRRKNIEIESIGVAGKHPSQQSVKKYFRMELIETGQQNVDKDQDLTALEEGFVTVTPLSLCSSAQPEVQSSVSNWLAVALAGDQ